MNGGHDIVRTVASSVILFFITIIIGLAVIREEGAKKDDGRGGGIQPGFDDAQVISAEELRQQIPSDWSVVKMIGKSKGWQQTGFINLGLDEAYHAVADLMGQNGYVLKLREPKNDESLALMSTKNVLAEFGGRHHRGRTMWALWRESDCKTGFSWGIPK